MSLFEQTLWVSLYALVYLIGVPSILFVAMMMTDWLYEPLIYHGIVNYLMAMMVGVLVWRLATIRVWGGGFHRYAISSSMLGIAYAQSGLDMEYLLVGSTPILCATIWHWKKDKALRVCAYVVLITCGVTGVHHYQFLGKLTNPRIEQRAVYAENALLSGSAIEFNKEGCALDAVVFETCQRFPLEYMANFTPRPDMHATLDALVENSKKGGGMSVASLTDKNDDVPVWTIGFDGEFVAVLETHDALYRELIVPIMGLAWWWSVVVWTILGASTVVWHAHTTPVMRRRDAGGFFIIWAPVVTATVCALYVASFFIAKWSEGLGGVYNPSDAEVLSKLLVELALFVPAAWVGIALFGIAFHRLAFSTRR